MLHLAKVINRKSSGNAELQLLAYQQADTIWCVMNSSTPDTFTPDTLSIAVSPDIVPYGEGVLVLVDLSDDRKIRSIQDATDWILDALAVPALLQQEVERMEKWRQSLTLESQELARRTLEVEARLENIQALEESLRQERKQERKN